MTHLWRSFSCNEFGCEECSDWENKTSICMRIATRTKKTMQNAISPHENGHHSKNLTTQKMRKHDQEMATCQLITEILVLEWRREAIKFSKEFNFQKVTSNDLIGLPISWHCLLPKVSLARCRSSKASFATKISLHHWAIPLLVTGNPAIKCRSMCKWT